MDAGVMVPLGVFAMLVAGWYLQTRANIAYVEALSRERVAAIEKGVPLPEKEAEPPKLPERASHPLKPTLAVLAVGIALWVGLAPDHRVWGMVVTAFGIAGLLPLVRRRQGRVEAPAGHGRGDAPGLRAIPESARLCLCFGRWPQSLTLSPRDAMTRTWSWPGAATAETLTPSARSSTASAPSSIPSARVAASPGRTARMWRSRSCSMPSEHSRGTGGRLASPPGSIPWRCGAWRITSAPAKGATCRPAGQAMTRSRLRRPRPAVWRQTSRPSGAKRSIG